MLSVCTGLVTSDPKSGIIPKYIILHGNTLSFFGLTWLPRHDSCIIVSVCLAYLSYHHFETYDSQIFASSAEKQDRSASKDDLMLKIYSTLFEAYPF